MYCATVYNRRMQIKLSNQGFILVLLPLAMQVTFMIIFLGMLQQAEQDIATERKSREIMGQVSQIVRLLLAAASGDSLLLEPSTGYGKLQQRHAAAGIPAAFARLRELCADRPEQLQVIEKLEGQWRSHLKATREMKVLVHEGSPLEAYRGIAKIKRSINQIRIALENGAIYFQEFDDRMPKIVAADRERQKQLLIAFLIANALMAVCLCIFFNIRTRHRLNILLENAKSLTMQHKIERPLEGNDELSELQLIMVSMAQNLTATQRKEKAILDNAGDIICSFDSAGIINSANQATRKLWGFSEEQLLGMKLPELIEPADWVDTQRHVADIKHSGTQSSQIENRIRTSSGASMHMVWNIHWSKDEQSYFCVVHDVSARRQLEKLKRDFMSMITHDIRSPITSVLAFLSLVEENVYGELNQKGRSKVKETEQSISLVVQLISDLLDLEKSEAGMLSLEIATTTSKKVMQKAIEAVQSQADAKEICIDLEGEDIELHADEARLSKVFINLLSNAIKFSPKETTITFDCKHENERITFSLSDEGQPIKPENLVSIFDLYRRWRSEDATARGGTGLGLAIAKAIVEKHYGTIHAESLGEKGSRFVVNLPPNPGSL